MKYIPLILAILISQSAGLIGSVFTTSAIPTWYAGLSKPALNPPGWVFGPVWVLLYTLMGIAWYLVWLKWGEISLAKLAVFLFAVHLVFNALWSILFFGLQRTDLAFFEIIILWLMIAALVIIFYRIRPSAAYLLAPYLAWVSFAAYLNFSIWRLNL